MFGFPLFEFLLLVLGFGFLIFVHELGHFLVAKWVGIRCPQFAIGFGHAICSWRKGLGFRIGGTEKEFRKLAIAQLKEEGVEPLGVEPPDEKKEKEKAKKKEDELEIDLSDLDLGFDDEDEEKKFYTDEQVFAATDKLGLSETEYRLNYLPLGGYVKMMGQEDSDPNAKAADPRAYNNKPIWARACVISAGVVMNLICGALFLTAAFMIGVDFPAATVGQVIPGMPASRTYAQGHDGDLRYLSPRSGDVILEINGQPPEDFKDVTIATALGSQDSPIEMVVSRRGDRPGEYETLTYVLTSEREEGGERLLSVGFTPGAGLFVGYDPEGKTDVANWFNDRMEANPAGDRTRDQGIRIVAAGGNDTEQYGDLLYAFDQSDGRPVAVTLYDPAAGDSADARFVAEVGTNPTVVRCPGGPANLLGRVPAGQIAFVAEDSPAEEIGLEVGDVVGRLGGLAWPRTPLQVAGLLAETKKTPLPLVVMRGGEVVDLGEITPNREGKLGVVVGPAYDSTVVGGLVEGSPADAAFNADGSFMQGTRITGINGQRVSDWREVQRALLQLAEQDPALEQVSMGYIIPVEGTTAETATLAVTPEQVEELLAAGWEPDFVAFSPLVEMETLKAEGVGEAFGIGLDKSKDFILQTYITLLRLVQGNVKLYNLRGPVGIVHVGTTVAQQGLPYLLFFLGLISINLAVINFLPIPIVDGGHMVFLAIEKIKGSPPSPQVQTAALYMGLAVIGFVFVTTLFYDVTRLFGF